MRNRHILHARQEVKIYEDYYKPSINPWRFLKSILGVLISGSSPVAQTFVTLKKKEAR